jgi:undecaprenyl-diphosphatase
MEAKKNKTTIKVIFLIIFFLSTVGFEFLYRDTLFDKNLIWAEDMQDNWGSSAENFFTIITEFGTLPVFLPIFIIIYLWFPIIISYSFILNFTYSSFIMNVLKIVYSNPRPYWVKPSLLLDCSSGFGNPSGHAFDSTAVYLSLWHLITEHSFFIKYWILKYILLVLFIGLVIAIILSRVYLGVHSINQVLYGISFGFCVYYLIFNILEIYKKDAKTFFNFFRNKNNNLLITLKFAIFLVVFMLIYFYRNADVSEYVSTLDDICPELKEVNKFNNDGLTKGLIYSIIIGTQYGIILLSNVILKYFPDSEEEINRWNRMGLKNSIYKILICGLFAIPGIAYILVSVHSSVIVFSLFKVSLPLLITLFNLYGPAIILIVRLKIANKTIYHDKIHSSIVHANSYTNVDKKIKDVSQIT